MRTIAQRFPWAPFGLVLALTLGGFALLGLGSTSAETLLFYWLCLAGLTSFAWYAIKGDILTGVFFWFVSLIMFHEEFWRQKLPFFFALTIPRIGIMVLVALFVAMVALGRLRIRREAWPIVVVILGVAAYFSVSAWVSGFETRSVVSVHYRLIGGYLFPFIVFGLVLHGFQRDHDFKRLAIFFAALSVYLTLTGWCEEFDLSALIWPRFIQDPTRGIHWGRVRGPFLMSAAMGLALIYCYFSNLVLAKNVAQGRWLLYFLNAAMLPVIFWTRTRSVWLSFLLCHFVWIAYSRRRISRVVSGCVLLAAGLLVAVVNMENLLSPDRARGGWTDMKPILLRVGLAQMTFEIIEDHPLLGVGFGHFRDHAPDFARDPSSPFYAFGTTALEHNNLLSILAETGLAGLFVYLFMVGLLLSYSIRLFRKLPARAPGIISRDLLALYWVLATAYFVDGMFRETSDNPFANSLFFGLSAIPVALNLLLDPKPIRARHGFPISHSFGFRRPSPTGRRPDRPDRRPLAPGGPSS